LLQLDVNHVPSAVCRLIQMDTFARVQMDTAVEFSH
jgi:hypothetical protein